VTPARLQALYAAREDLAPVLEDLPAERPLVAGRC
jgi:phosphonate transport system ATP-binding protein